MVHYLQTPIANRITYLYSVAMKTQRHSDYQLTQFDQIKDTVSEFVNKNPDGIVILWGATATGKTGTSVKLSRFFPSEVISSDSRQIFRKMDIGTDKISQSIRDALPHHLIDIVNPDQHYTAWQWQTDAKKTIQEIQSRQRLPLIVGGTGLYIDTLYKNFAMPDVPPNYPRRQELYAMEENEAGILHRMLQKVDPASAAVNHPHSTRYIVRALEIYETTGQAKSVICQAKPVNQPILMLGLWRDKESTQELINQRVSELIEAGLAQEVEWLLAMWYDESLQSMQGIGYKETVHYLQGFLSKDERTNALRQATYRLAKKQRSWFRRYLNDAENNPKQDVTYKVFSL